MINIKEVTTRKMRHQFVSFPLDLYRGNPYFVPPLYGDEMKVFSKKNAYYETSISSFFLAFKDDRVAGRISGIIQTQSNEKTGERRARFTRFDAIDDQEVADALFLAVEKWAAKNGMDLICGPLGYSDLEREGLLIEGFNHIATFEEQYNYEYYGRLIENYGFEKEVDWVEYKLYRPESVDPTLDRVADAAMEKFRLHIGTGKNKRQYINKYKDGIFHCLDEGYKELYGTVPFTKEMKQQIITQFMLLLNLKFMITVCDEHENVVAFGLSVPSLGPAFQESGGRLNVKTVRKMMKIIKKPDVIDLGLIAVLPEYQSLAFNAIILRHLIQGMMRENISYCETNLNLENNVKVQAQWRFFPREQHKKRRSYLKKIAL
ncbi:MAG: hypothetical protein WC344_03820 [Bacilli bacterium]|jgi:hypothetical protein